MIKPNNIFVFTIYYLLLTINLFFSNSAFAEYKPQAKELFWIDVPEGWTMSEDPSTVLLVNPTQSEQVYIRFKPIEGNLGDQEEFLTDMRDQKRREIASRGGKSVMKVERKMDGAFSLQTGFLIPSERGILQGTSIYFLHDGKLFDVYFEAPYEVQRLEMEAVIDTLRFKKPEPPEEVVSEEKKPQAYEVDVPVVHQAVSE